jgi:hypothetical protein
VSDRTLWIRTVQFKPLERRSDGNLMREVIEQRDGLLSWLALKAQALCEASRHAPAGLDFRFQDFAALFHACWVSKCPDEEREVAEMDVRSVLSALKGEQVEFVAATDLLVDVIVEHRGELNGFSGSAKHLAKRLRRLNPDLPPLPQKQALTNRLREIMQPLEVEGVALEESEHKGRPQFKITLRKSQESSFVLLDNGRWRMNLAGVQAVDGNWHPI